MKKLKKFLRIVFMGVLGAFIVFWFVVAVIGIGYDAYYKITGKKRDPVQEAEAIRREPARLTTENVPIAVIRAELGPEGTVQAFVVRANGAIMPVMSSSRLITFELVAEVPRRVALKSTDPDGFRELSEQFFEDNDGKAATSAWIFTVNAASRSPTRLALSLAGLFTSLITRPGFVRRFL